MAKIQKLKTPELPEGGHIWDDNDPRNHVYVDTRSHVTWEGDTDPNDSWDRPDTDTSFDGVIVWAEKPDIYYAERFPVRAQVQPGDEVHVLVVRYTTGDTFGTDSGNVAVAAVEVEKFMADALCTKMLARRDGGYDFNNGGNTVEYEGWGYYMGSWLGYFEHIEDIFVESVTVK